MLHVLRATKETCHWGYFDAALAPAVLAQKSIQPWNCFANEDRDQRYSAMNQSAALLRRGFAAWGSERACLRATQWRTATTTRHRDGGTGSVAGNSSGCATLVAMVQAADLWEGNNGACRGWLYGPRLRAILAEREMCAASVVVLKVCR
jgi:hypothetical protein